MKLIFDFCLLFFVRFCSLLTHEISRAAHQLGIYVFTTKTIMDPLIGFLDCVLVSQCCFYVFFFFAPARPDTFEASVCCWWSFSFRRFIVDRRGTQKWGMFDDFDLQIKAPFCVVSQFSFLAFRGFRLTPVHLVNSTRVAMPINRRDAHSSHTIPTSYYLSVFFLMGRGGQENSNRHRDNHPTHLENEIFKRPKYQIISSH